MLRPNFGKTAEALLWNSHARWCTGDIRPTSPPSTHPNAGARKVEPDIHAVFEHVCFQRACHDREDRVQKVDDSATAALCQQLGGRYMIA